MVKGQASLRSTMASVTIIVTILALVVSSALVLLTTALHHTTTSSSASVESVRLAEEAEVDLLLYQRAIDPILQQKIESQLVRRLTEARAFLTSSEEELVLDAAVREVLSYVGSMHDPGVSAQEISAKQVAAYEALERFVEINIDRSKESQRAAARWDRLGSVIGFGVGALLVGVAIAVVLWLRRRAFAQVFALADVMERFARGESDARAVETGPKELREMCTRFNEMAATIAAQRQAQIAFLGGVAHDLRNPLGALAMSVSFLDPSHPLPSEERIRQTVARISRQIARMDRMVGDFLDVAKIEGGQLELRIAIHDVRQVVQDAVALLEDSAPKHQLVVELPPRAARVVCDPLRIEQVITNLVSNAIKYSHGGRVEIGVEMVGDEVAITVTDHGMGISEADRARLFEPFRRVGLSKESVPGVGLGLFVVRRIVEAHRGRIEVQSTLGKGSTFRVLLPAASAVPEQARELRAGETVTAS